MIIMGVWVRHHEANGVNLPRFKKHVPHSSMPNAIAHSQVHTDIYHENVVTMLIIADATASSKDDIIEVLREIGNDLQAGTFLVDKLMNEI